MVARVMWVNRDRFGVHTQDCVAVEAIAGGGPETIEECASAAAGARPKRRELTADERLERSRKRAAAMQFLWIIGLGAAGGAMVFDAVSGALSRPLSVVSAELGRD